MSRTVPKTLTVTTQTAVDVPRDLVTTSTLDAEWPDLGLRLIRRLVYRRDIRVFKIAGKTLVSRADFAAYLAAGVENPRS